MKVLSSSEADVMRLIKSSRLKLHDIKVNSGDSVLVGTEKYLMGPMKVLEASSQDAVLLAVQGFNYFKPAGVDDADLDDLSPLLIPDSCYCSVTGNIFLDGFLGASYIDGRGMLRVDLSRSCSGLWGYFKNQMDACGVQYREIKDGFAILDESMVEGVFESIRPNMPVSYFIGYACSFVMLVRVEAYRNPQYARFSFTLDSNFEAFNNQIPEGIVVGGNKNNFLGSFFGEFPPLKQEIESRIEEDDAPVHQSSAMSLLPEVLPDVVRLLFHYAGYAPTVQSENPYVLSVLKERLSEERCTVQVSDGTLPAGDVDFVVSLDDRDMTISCQGAGEYGKTQCNFNSCDQFDFGKEMGEYFTMLLRSL